MTSAVDDPRNCPALFASWDLDKAEACRFQNEIINEAVGEQVPLVNLPGCNALWSGNVSKPACPAGTLDGGDLDLVQPSVWYQGEPYIA